MVTENRTISFNGYISTVYVLSSDLKPVKNISNGSACVEIDTGDIYRFDEDHDLWIKQPTGSGGAVPAAGEVF